MDIYYVVFGCFCATIMELKLWQTLWPVSLNIYLLALYSLLSPDLDSSAEGAGRQETDEGSRRKLLHRLNVAGS